MSTTTVLPRSTGRDRALLRAVAAGRCTVNDDACHSLAIDGVCFCDQFAAVRLAGAGLVEPAGRARGPRPLRLTDTGRSLLAAA
ncbi:hypothetical protein H7X46_14810 [Pseudonocardia sp. C8]|uniref:hypothetical protein n=1 Tax=Pseudonocardia sp. C8 TaxID=2762759 RepID=UPI001642A6FD|nr:hypothetical protein [Pseudonocardia sp. C8]MBC3192334.1 hypothetical protein [Pseudonocardia sp. C8]